MKRKLIQNFCLVLLLIIGLGVIQANADVVTVKNAQVVKINSDGEGSHVSIQQAVYSAQDGDIIVVGPGVYKDGSYDENVKVSGETTILSYSSLTGKWDKRTYVLGEVPGGDIYHFGSTSVTVFDNLTPEVQTYLENLGYSPVAQTESERKPDPGEYNDNPAYKKWYDAGEIVGKWDTKVTGMSGKRHCDFPNFLFPRFARLKCAWVI